MEITNNYYYFPKAKVRTPHFLILPWLAPGHFIPATDIARLLAQHDASVTIITTPVNAARIRPSIDRFNAASASASAGSISLVSLYFPATEVGLPEGCENIDLVPSMPLVHDFYSATKLFRQQVSRYIHEQLAPHVQVSCIISGAGYVWAADVARELGVPCFAFHGFGSFALYCCEMLHKTKAHETPSSSAEQFNVPGLPFEFKIARKELPMHFQLSKQHRDMAEEIRNFERAVDGILVNSFDQLEPGYPGLLQEVSGKRIFTIGPVSLCNTTRLDMEERGNKATDIEADRCIEWLNSKRPNSVIYVCFGSTGSFAPKQLRELGLGLLASSWPFIWVIKDVHKLPDETLIWLRENFEEKNNSNSKSLLIRGWAPQISILSHSAVGVFVTHCGWNSTLESIAAGVPVVTWPLYSEQFLNVKLIVDVLKIGVSVGVREAMAWRGSGDEHEIVRVKKEDLAGAIERLMNGGEEERRRVAELKEKAKLALEKNGSSSLNLESLIEFVTITT